MTSERKRPFRILQTFFHKFLSLVILLMLPSGVKCHFVSHFLTDVKLGIMFVIDPANGFRLLVTAVSFLVDFNKSRIFIL